MKFSPLLALLVWFSTLSTPLWAEDPPPRLVGHWELIEQPYHLSIEFNNNGVYIAFTPQGVMTGRWESLDGLHLSTWSNVRLPKRNTRYTIEGDILTITGASGLALKHRRVLLEKP